MRICNLASVEEVHTQRWVKYFADRRHEVHLISYGTFRSNNIGDARFYVLKGFRPQIRIISSLINLIFTVIQVRRLIKRIKPDILHAHYVTEYGFPAALSGFHPLILSAWGSDILVEPKKSRLSRWMAKKALSKADLVTCDGDNISEEMIKLGADPKKIRLILHGVELGRFNPEQKDELLRTNLDLFDSPVIISIRNLKPRYDIETLIRAIPLVSNEIPKAKFVIAGEGELKDFLQSLAKSLGVWCSIRFAGWIPHKVLPYYLTLADVYVCTSLSEGGASVSLTEAMACGLAPVVTDVGDKTKWIRDEENGFVIPTKRPDLLAEKIIYLLKNKELRQKMGKANRRLVEERADYEKEMDKVEKLYEKLIGRSIG